MYRHVDFERTRAVGRDRHHGPSPLEAGGGHRMHDGDGAPGDLREVYALPDAAGEHLVALTRAEIAVRGLMVGVCQRTW